METRKLPRKRSLLGDRQGTSGASAGCDSGRATGGSRLNRRTTTELTELTTADNQTTEQPHQQQTHTSQTTKNKPPERVLSDQPLTTKGGKQRQRMQWTNEMNLNLMRCYYTVTQGETITAGYRTELHRKFSEIYPELSHITEQRLADQKPEIITNNRIPQPVLNMIKQNALLDIQTTEEEIDKNNHTASKQIMDATQDINAEADINETWTEDRTLEHPTSMMKNLQIEDMFNQNYNLFSNTDPTRRPYIPKLNITKETSTTIKELNAIIEKNDQTTLYDLHLLVYCAAFTTVQLNNQKIIITDPEKDTKPSNRKTSMADPNRKKDNDPQIKYRKAHSKNQRKYKIIKY